MSSRITGVTRKKGDNHEEHEDVPLGTEIPIDISYVAESPELPISARTPTPGYKASLAKPALGKLGTYVQPSHLVIVRDETAEPVNEVVEVFFKIGSSLERSITLKVKQ